MESYSGQRPVIEDSTSELIPDAQNEDLSVVNDVGQLVMLAWHYS
jgi:hypothetical protein